MQKIDYFAKYIFDKMRAFLLCHTKQREIFYFVFKALFYDIFDIANR